MIDSYFRDVKPEELQKHILTILKKENPPDTIAGILKEINLIEELPYIYKQEVARSVWQLVDKGDIVVRSGKIYEAS